MALPYIYPGLQVVSGLMGQKKLSFGKAMVKKIEFWQNTHRPRINDSGTQTVKIRKLSLVNLGVGFRGLVTVRRVLGCVSRVTDDRKPSIVRKCVRRHTRI